ncbi:MAG TPA: hypothetical protein VK826_04320, partial [Bacteroidia bacterium]|nr:hypothetical protein [Bacteroidia bacterium]
SLKKNYKPTPMPAGFVNYFTIQEETNQKETTRETGPRPVEQPAEQPKAPAEQPAQAPKH